MEKPTAANPKITTCDPVEGFTPQIGRYVAQLTEVRDDLKHEVAGLSTAQLDWHPNDQVESIGTLLLHCDAVEWSWMHEDVLGKSSDEYTGDWAEVFGFGVGVDLVSVRSLLFLL